MDRPGELDTRETVHAALAALPPDGREMIYRRYFLYQDKEKIAPKEACFLFGAGFLRF
ncbi:MAG: hypothetical protein ACOY40_03095 [Bacillota bacterium]